MFFILHNHARTKTPPFVPQSTHRRADDAIHRRIDVRGGGIPGDRERREHENPEAFTRCRSSVETSLRIIIICVRVRWKREDDPALARE